MGAELGDDDDATTSIDFFDVSRCLATSIDIDKCRWRGWAQTRATTTTSIDFIDVSRCLATSIDVDTCIVGGADGRRAGRRRRGRRRKILSMSLDDSGYITALDFSALDFCEVCTEAVHSVALCTRVTVQLWTCVK